MAETFARGAIFVLVVMVLWLGVMLIRRLWRAVTGFSVNKAAHTAGVITDAAQRRSAGIVQSFKDGRGR